MFLPLAKGKGLSTHQYAGLHNCYECIVGVYLEFSGLYSMDGRFAFPLCWNHSAASPIRLGQLRTGGQKWKGGSNAHLFPAVLKTTTGLSPEGYPLTPPAKRIVLPLLFDCNIQKSLFPSPFPFKLHWAQSQVLPSARGVSSNLVEGLWWSLNGSKVFYRSFLPSS